MSCTHLFSISSTSAIYTLSECRQSSSKYSKINAGWLQTLLAAFCGTYFYIYGYIFYLLLWVSFCCRCALMEK